MRYHAYSREIELQIDDKEHAKTELRKMMETFNINSDLYEYYERISNLLYKGRLPGNTVLELSGRLKAALGQQQQISTHRTVHFEPTTFYHSRIILSKSAFEIFPDKMFNTFLHEILHVAAANDEETNALEGHGGSWKRQAEEISALGIKGLKIERHYKDRDELGNCYIGEWLQTCTQCGNESNTPTRREGYVCGRCKSPLEETNYFEKLTKHREMLKKQEQEKAEKKENTETVLEQEEEEEEKQEQPPTQSKEEEENMNQNTPNIKKEKEEENVKIMRNALIKEGYDLEKISLGKAFREQISKDIIRAVKIKEGNYDGKTPYISEARKLLNNKTVQEGLEEGELQELRKQLNDYQKKSRATEKEAIKAATRELTKEEKTNPGTTMRILITDARQILTNNLGGKAFSLLLNIKSRTESAKTTAMFRRASKRRAEQAEKKKQEELKKAKEAKKAKKEEGYQPSIFEIVEQEKAEKKENTETVLEQEEEQEEEKEQPSTKEKEEKNMKTKTVLEQEEKLELISSIKKAIKKGQAYERQERKRAKEEEDHIDKAAIYGNLEQHNREQRRRAEKIRKISISIIQDLENKELSKEESLNLEKLKRHYEKSLHLKRSHLISAEQYQEEGRKSIQQDKEEQAEQPPTQSKEEEPRAPKEGAKRPNELSTSIQQEEGQEKEKEEASKILSRAKKKHDEMLRKAKREYQSTIEKANLKREEILNQAETEHKKILEKANTEHDVILDQANIKSKEILNQADTIKKEAQMLLNQAKEKQEQKELETPSTARQQSDYNISRIQEEAEKEREEIRSEYQQLQKENRERAEKAYANLISLEQKENSIGQEQEEEEEDKDQEQPSTKEEKNRGAEKEENTETRSKEEEQAEPSANLKQEEPSNIRTNIKTVFSNIKKRARDLISQGKH